MTTRLAVGALVAKRFRLDRKLGEGGMGEVWAATHTVTLRQVALKFLKPRAKSQQQRFMREARAASVVQHPNVVRVEDVFELDDGMPVMVMELLDGESLQTHLDRNSKLTLEQLGAILLPAVAAVGAGHAAGVVHRDLKPDNIFLAAGDDDAVEVKVLDFGIAKLALADDLAGGDGGLTKTGALLGTPNYMSPEQACGERIDHRTDIWSLGMIAYQALSGVLPTKAETVGGVLKVVMTGQIEPFSSLSLDLPADVVDLVTGMLAQDPAGRPTDLRQVAAVLERHTTTQAAAFGAAKPLTTADRQPANAELETGEWLAEWQTGGDSSAASAADAGADQLGHADTKHAPGSEPPIAGVAAQTSLAADDSAGTARATPLPRPVEGQMSTTAATTATPAHSPPARSPFASILVALVLLVAVGAVWWSRMQPAEPQVAPATSTSGQQTRGPARPTPKPPRMGLKAIEHYRTPPASQTGTLQSATWWEAAAKDFAKALEQPDAPVRWKAARHFALGKAQLLRDERDAAVASFRKSIALEPGWAVPQTGLATALVLAGDTKGAIAATQEAQRLEPEWWGAVAVSAKVLNQANRLNEAIQEYRRALAMAPNEPALLAELALVYHAAKLDSEATRYAKMALEADPDLVSVRLMLAERALEKNDGKAALAEATRAVAVAPRDPASRLARADALVLVGKRADAMDAYKETLRLLEKTAARGLPAARVKLVRQAVAAGRLPPPRAASKTVHRSSGTKSKRAKQRWLHPARR